MNSIKHLAVAMTIALAPMTALAADEPTDATVSIVAALGITEDAALDFGIVVANATLPGDVTISQAGAQSCDAVLTCSQGAAADYTVTGTGDNTYSISLDNANVTLTGAGTPMTATLDAPSDDALSSGTDTFSIGGVLTVGASQAVGDYTGTFTVTVEYN